MNFSLTFQTIQELLRKIPFNVFDYILLFAFAFYVWEESSLGAVVALSNLISVILAFFLSLLSYAYMSYALTSFFQLSKGLSDAISFLVLASITYIILAKFISYTIRRLRPEIPRPLSKILGVVLGAYSFYLISSFIVSLLLSFPISPTIKTEIRNSFTGNFLLTKTQTMEFATKHIFGGAINETLNFLTVKPDPNNFLKLHFQTTNVSVDRASELRMITLVNDARAKKGIPQLTEDKNLTDIARSYGKEMLKQGYFSHYTPDGFSPFDRLEKQSIPYTTAAENLAYAPDSEIAFAGLMNSEGHRRNMLDPGFNKIGIGVIDAGMYGKLFVQEFTD